MTARLQFPYMFWAHSHAMRSPYCLSQSGMPTADAGIFAGIGGVDLGHPSAEALPALEAKVADAFGVDKKRVIAVLGASGGMHTAALRYFRPGAQVVVDVPSYEPFRALPTYLGAQVRPLRRRVEDGWQVDPAEVRRLLGRGDGPGHVFLSNLHNPSGVLLERERLAQIAKVAADANGVAIVCEVYMEYVPSARRVHAFDVAPNGISVGSLTKAYGLGPLRVGWIVLGEALVHERDALRDMTYLSYVDPPTVCLRAGVRAFERLGDLLKPLAVIEHESRPIWKRWLEQTPGVRATVPEFGIIAFPRIEGVHDTLALAEFLAVEHGVDVVPGEFFGTPGHLRVGCGVPAETLRTGLERLAAGLSAWRARAT